ncbi:hypothetical protein DRE_07237 [Drechslerella stenobrocha 248]|uniref:Uncharacterized protein n=1 Tax=Drechslerella stenobrocha 248 TaxID=1043628 RepID=W7I531_9PEZI|nr:hypothetical protein DRE_07237 [Drechslerella stenobrocha 248]
MTRRGCCPTCGRAVGAAGLFYIVFATVTAAAAYAGIFLLLTDNFAMVFNIDDLSSGKLISTLAVITFHLVGYLTIAVFLVGTEAKRVMLRSGGVTMAALIAAVAWWWMFFAKDSMFSAAIARLCDYKL